MGLFQTNLTNYCKRNHCKHYLQKFLSDNSVHFKLYFLFIANSKDNSFKTIMRKIITNNAFKSESCNKYSHESHYLRKNKF